MQPGECERRSNPQKKNIFKMPIVNGSYVTQPLGTPKDVQNQVFGGYTRKDMSDFTQAAYNYQMQQQQQAFELEMWNLKNQYDSPEAQMARYQQAGLNPYLIYGQQNLSGNVPQGSPAVFRSSGASARHAQNAMNFIGQMRGIIESAYETWKYFSPYERNMRSFDQQLAGLSLRRNQSEADWLDYLTYGRSRFEDPTDLSRVPSGYRAQMYNLEANTKEENYNRLKALANMIPDQQARTQALKSLDDKRLEILRGQNDAILNIQTGNSTVDAWLRALMYFAMSKI